MSLGALERSLEEGVQPLYVMIGDAAPMIAAAVEQVRAAVEPDLGAAAFNLTQVRATDADAAEAFRTARTLPMMGSRRLVIVRGLEEGTDAFYEAAVAYVQAPVPEAVVVLVGQRFPKVVKGGKNWSAPIKKGAKAHGLFVSLATKDVPAPSFVIDQAQRHGKRMAREAAELLVAAIGDDLSRLQHEVDKLSLYVGERPEITSDDIEAASALLADAAIWDLTSALATGDADEALACVHRLQEGGDDPRRLLGMIAWQMRDLLRVAARVQAGVPDRQIRKDVRMRYGVYQKVRPRMQRGFPHAGELMGRLADANRQMNGHRAGAARVLEELVLELVALTR